MQTKTKIKTALRGLCGLFQREAAAFDFHKAFADVLSSAYLRGRLEAAQADLAQKEAELGQAERRLVRLTNQLYDLAFAWKTRTDDGYGELEPRFAAEQLLAILREKP